MTAVELVPREVLASHDGALRWMPEAEFWRLKKSGAAVWARDVGDIGLTKIRGPR